MSGGARYEDDEVVVLHGSGIGEPSTVIMSGRVANYLADLPLRTISGERIDERVAHGLDYDMLVDEHSKPPKPDSSER